MVYSSTQPTTAVTAQSLQDLVSHGHPIKGKVIALSLEVVCCHYDTCFLTPHFLPLLVRDGWVQVRRYFASTRSRHRCTTFRPHVQGEKAIAIPCHIDNNHWVAVTRREHNGQVYFLYADDLNNLTTEGYIRNKLHNTDPDFYPPTAQWIRCTNYTYRPHSTNVVQGHF